MEQMWTYSPEEGYTIAGRISKKRHPAVPASRPFHPIAQVGLARLHRELRKCLPELAGVRPLSKALLKVDFAIAVASTGVSDAKYWYLEANCLKRFQGKLLSDAVVREDAAVEKLLASEVRCRHSNAVMTDVFNRGWVPPHIRTLLVKTKSNLQWLLGRFDWEEFPKAVNFTPGATTEFTRKNAATHNKWEFGAHITPRALPYAMAFRRWAGEALIGDRRFEIVTANKVFTVPKDFDCDRTACKPITWNGAFQKATGRMIRRRAQQKVRLLLPDAQDYHRVLAKIGSKLKTLTTADLVGASDGISLGLIDSVFPRDWADVLFDLREEDGELPDGTIIKWEKLSTMGNGYTFEVQTILFWALVSAVCGKGSLVSIFGDDLIFPSQYTERVYELLMYCGLEINRDKSFSDGDFRESCGGHYFGGEDIKPFYITDLPRSIGDIINLHNGIVRWHVGKPASDSRWFRVWRVCRELIPRKFWGPAGMEGCLWAEWDECRPVFEPSIQCWRIAGVHYEQDRIDTCESFGAYLEKLWESGEEASEKSTYRLTTEKEKTSWRYLDRAQWTRFTAETLCT